MSANPTIEPSTARCAIECGKSAPSPPARSAWFSLDTLPADAKDVKQTKGQINFTVGKGKAKAAVESFRTQFRDAGWKENFAAVTGMSGAVSFSKRRRAEC
jgi:hypothetical protein